MSSRSSLLLAGMYPPSTRPAIRIVLFQGVRRGITLVSSTLAETIVFTGAETAGAIVALRRRRRLRSAWMGPGWNDGRPAAIAGRCRRRDRRIAIRAVVRRGQDGYDLVARVPSRSDRPSQPLTVVALP